MYIYLVFINDYGIFSVFGKSMYALLLPSSVFTAFWCFPMRFSIFYFCEFATKTNTSPNDIHNAEADIHLADGDGSMWDLDICSIDLEKCKILMDNVHDFSFRYTFYVNIGLC
jgi:hypothetical protein